jgi:hypothetical protein
MSLNQGGAFETVTADGEPQRLRCNNHLTMIELYDWLQLTIGRFLAPARLNELTRPDYLLLGSPQAQLSQSDIELEVDRFADAIRSVSVNLRSLIGSDLARTHVLLSLDALLSLNLPPPNEARSFHVRGGLLQVTDWGLKRGVRVSSLLPDEARSYCAQLKHTLVEKYRGVRGSASPGASQAARSSSTDQKPWGPPVPRSLELPPVQAPVDLSRRPAQPVTPWDEFSTSRQKSRKWMQWAIILICAASLIAALFVVHRQLGLRLRPRDGPSSDPVRAPAGSATQPRNAPARDPYQQRERKDQKPSRPVDRSMDPVR